jgi:1-phosphofructokinase
MIVTLTANPSLDRTVELGAPLARGEVQRATGTSVHPGGKGVNVSRALIASGLDTVAVLPGDASDPMLVALRAERIPTAGLPIEGRVRSNITLTEPDGTTTKINEPGPTLTHEDMAALIGIVVAHARNADWLVLAGSLPPGLPTDFYASVVRAVRDSGSEARIAVDSSGPPMLALIDSGVGVDLVKPNAEELAELTGHPAGTGLEDDLDAAASAAASLVGRGCRAVLATLGGRGALLVTADGADHAAAWHATMPPITVRSTVGAGDASLAGYLLAEQHGATVSGRLAQAVAHGAAAASLAGSGMPAAHDTEPHAAILTELSAPSAQHAAPTQPARPTQE